MTAPQSVQPTTRRRRNRRPVVAMMLAVLAAACTDTPPSPPPMTESLAPPTYDFLTKMRLKVASINIDDSWVPKGGEQQVAHLAPTPPLDALRQMAQDRLVAAGLSGHGVFVIDDASIIRTVAGYHGSFSVHLDVMTSDGTRSGFAEAHVTRERSSGGNSPDAVRLVLAEMTRLMMNDMNVEFEYQVRHSLRAYLVSSQVPTEGAASVESQDLSPPPGIRAAPSTVLSQPAVPPASSADPPAVIDVAPPVEPIE